MRARGTSPADLVKTIVHLSDHYQNPSSTTPWTDEAIELAYCSYFLPLNFLRIRHALEEGLRVGFFPSNLNKSQYLDFGSGPGVVTLALESLDFQFKKGICVELSSRAEGLYQKLTTAHSDLQWRQDFPTSIAHTVDYAFCSFSLNELEDLPKWLFKIENLVLLEPSTQLAGRRLQETRQKLIEDGYSIWAPCLHQLRCPQLLHSQKDWCHQRVAIELPDGMEELQKHLPMRNENITYSYLLASKRPAPKVSENTFRITGDMLREKGKSRIMACRGENREFLSWMKRHGEAPDIRRGELFECENFEIKGNELRAKPQ